MRLPACIGPFLLVFALAAPARATDVPASIGRATRWTVAGSPWRVTTDVTVQNGATLTIDPGAVVEVANASPPLGLTVLGTLVAAGTQGLPVVFRANPGGRGAWRGLRVSSSTPGSSVKFAQIFDAVNALWVDGPAAAELADVTVVTTDVGIRLSGGTTLLARPLVANAWGSGILVEGSAKVSITDAVVKSGRAAGLEVSAPAGATVRRSRFVAGELGVKVAAGASLSLESSLVAGNLDGGVLFAQAGAGVVSLVNDTIDRNAMNPAARLGGPHGGIHATAVDAPAKVTVRNCLVTNHGTTGLRVDGAFVTLDTNDVWNNVVDYQGAAPDPASRSFDPRYARPLFASAPAPDAAWQSHDLPLAWNAPAGGWHGHWYVELYDVAWIRAQVESFQGGTGDELRVGDRTGAIVSTFTGNQFGPSAPGHGAYLDVFLDSANAARFRIGRFETLPLSYDAGLSSGSPAIDTGSASGAAADDADGFARPYDGDGSGGAAPDLGAFEFHGNLAPVAAAGPDQAARPGAGVVFDGSGSRDPDGTIRRYDWDFGDGTPAATGAVVTHPFAAVGAFTVALTVTDDRGATGRDTAVVTVAQAALSPPVARAGGPYASVVGRDVSFDGSRSTGADGVISGYSWGFGDGATAAGATAKHAYASAGTFTVTLEVADAAGLSSTDTTSVAVRPPDANQPPVARAGADLRVDQDAPAALDGSASSDPDGTIAVYSWDFGDGETALGAQVRHVFPSLGENRVTLTVTDDAGQAASDEVLVTVNARPEAVVTGPRTVRINANAAFDGGASVDPDGMIVAWRWTFDGRTFTGPKATFVWPSAGEHQVTLEVTDDLGATGTATLAVQVTATAAEDGCSCASPGPGPLAFLGLGLVALRRRRPDAAGAR